LAANFFNPILKIEGSSEGIEFHPYAGLFREALEFCIRPRRGLQNLRGVTGDAPTTDPNLNLTNELIFLGLADGANFNLPKLPI
jgi:hypothetical protein